MGSNLDEAIEELQRIRDILIAGKVNEDDLQIKLRHAYHHLNFVWNARRASLAEYRQMTRSKFQSWGKYPSDLDDSPLAS